MKLQALPGPRRRAARARNAFSALERTPSPAAHGRAADALDERQRSDVISRSSSSIWNFLPALGERRDALGGTLSGQLAAYGPLAALQLKTTKWRLLIPRRRRSLTSFNFDLRAQDGRADANLRATFRVSAPLTATASVPLRLEKSRLADGSWLNREAPFFARGRFSRALPRHDARTMAAADREQRDHFRGRSIFATPCESRKSKVWPDCSI